MDLADLEEKVFASRFSGRVKFGSFSAGSNITGVKTPVYDVARICHRHNVGVFFDFAAVAPYAEINMNKDGESYFDAIFFSPHKFLGGPGSSGILVIDERFYRRDLPPTTAGAGRKNQISLWKTISGPDPPTFPARPLSGLVISVRPSGWPESWRRPP